MSKIILIFILYTSSIFSQSNCNLSTNRIGTIPIVKSEDIKCIAKESKNRNTIFYSFGIWCSPCKLHLKNAIELKKIYDINLIILLVENQKDSIISKTINYLKNIDSEINIAVIDDSYGIRRSKKYRKFLKEITPEKFENLDGMSKYIVLDKKGQVIMVTTWKDNRKYDWKDDTNMIKEKILPLIQLKK